MIDAQARFLGALKRDREALIGLARPRGRPAADENPDAGSDDKQRPEPPQNISGQIAGGLEPKQTAQDDQKSAPKDLAPTHLNLL